MTAAQIEEVVKNYDADGIFLDIACGSRVTAKAVLKNVKRARYGSV